jgi:uncharacterized membrane protein HdeD (DUF308 family)
MTGTRYGGELSPGRDLLVALLARNWWAIGLRGVLAIVFGLIALFLPGATILSLVFLFAAYAFFDGVFAIVSAVRAAETGGRRGLLVIEGLVDIVVAVLAVVWPGITAIAFVLIVAAWAIVTGALELAVAFRLGAADGRWWLVVGGVVSLLYGALLIVAPTIGAVVLT